MGKKSRTKHEGAGDIGSSAIVFSKTDSSTIDPNLDALFTSSLPVGQPERHAISDSSSSDDVATGHVSNSDRNADKSTISSDEEAVSQEPLPQSTKVSKKRKHDAHDDVEGKYLQRLAHEQEVEDVRRKRVKQHSVEAKSNDHLEHDSPELSEDDASDRHDSFVVPQHESLVESRPTTELQKASCTVFLGNVSTTCIKSKSSKRQLMDHLASFLPDLPQSKTEHKLESIRFRSTAYSTSSVPRKAAFAKKELMDATTQSTNAYAVYSSALAAREAVNRLNGTVVLNRHLRVDSVAHPSKVDHRRCVFVGNLGFVDDESNMKSAQELDTGKPKKNKPSADVEEGLWIKFGEVGVVEGVRVVRDKTTRVGKGFAYVQFKDPNSVEKALEYNDKKFPPLLPRKLRVTRAKNITKSSSYSAKDAKKPQSSRAGIYKPKPSSEIQSMAGRAGKLLGRAGAAKARKPGIQGVQRTPENVIFEGHRARSNQTAKTHLGKSTKQNKRTSHSNKRAAAFKTSGKKK